MNQRARVAILGISIFGLAALWGCAKATPTSTEPPMAATQVAPTAVSTAPASGQTPTSTKAAPSPTPTTKGIADLLQKAAGVKGVRYDQVATAPGGEKVTSKVAMKGNKFRVDTQFQGQTSTFIADAETKVAYVLVPGQKVAMKVSYDQFQQTGSQDSPTDRAKAIDPNARIVGTEVIDGKTTTVVEFSSPQSTTKAWVWNDYGIPIKVEASSPQGTTTIEYKNIDTSEPPDSLFEVPPDYQVMQLPVGPPGGTVPQVPGR
ncbi:MAG: hypothetical protein HYX89_02450 [Chloroflexi bacterium]|nr:hypothetical protein [Chloroflexota bacterium]